MIVSRSCELMMLSKIMERMRSDSVESILGALVWK